MRLFPVTLLLLACVPDAPPAEPIAPARGSLHLYMHIDGKTRCVEESSGEWRANATCCPRGFSPAGFSTGAATAFTNSEDVETRRLYRHLVCLEDR